VTVGHTVHGVELYRFKLLVPVDLAAISADGNIVAFAYGMVMRVFLRGELSCEVVYHSHALTARIVCVDSSR